MPECSSTQAETINSAVDSIFKPAQGSKPLVKHFDQVQSALSAKEARALGSPVGQEWIKLNRHVEQVRKFRAAHP